MTVGAPLVCYVAATKEGVRLTIYCAAATDIPQPHNGEWLKAPPALWPSAKPRWLGARLAKVGVSMLVSIPDRQTQRNCHVPTIGVYKYN